MLVRKMSCLTKAEMFDFVEVLTYTAELFYLWHFDCALVLLSTSLYVSKRGAYWDKLCRDVVGHWLVVTRVHCGQTVHPRPIVTMEHRTLIGNPTPGIQWYNFRPPGVTPNRGIGHPWGAFCQITLTSCLVCVGARYLLLLYIVLLIIGH